MLEINRYTKQIKVTRGDRVTFQAIPLTYVLDNDGNKVIGTGSVYYKVWLTETTKGVIERTFEQMLAVYTAVRTSQLEAYSWYEKIKAELNAANTIEELEMIYPINLREATK